MDKVLCLDCLKVKDFTYERHLGKELCECGGEFCGCEECMHTVKMLKKGYRKADEIGCMNDVKYWTEDKGAIW